jgi:phosphohistidine phosphatase
MQRLVILRHGDAEKARGGMADFDRGLTEEGRAESLSAGRLLAEAGVQPELAVVSDARRARETWEAAAAAFGPVELRLDHQLYNATLPVLARAADAALAEASTAVVVGHNPGLHGLALELARGDGAGQGLGAGFPTGTAAVFAFEDGRPRLERLIRGEHGR